MKNYKRNLISAVRNIVNFAFIGLLKPADCEYEGILKFD